MSWHRHRSAPPAALLTAALAVLIAVSALATLHLTVLRPAKGLPTATAGLPPASTARPRAGRAAYHGRLTGPEGLTTPAGRTAIAHRWQLRYGTEVLCEGESTGGLALRDATGIRAVALPPPGALFVREAPGAPPPVLLAVCGARIEPYRSREGFDEHALSHHEWRIAPEAPVEVVACATGPDPADPIGPCDDGAPSRIYPREPPARARARIRQALRKVHLAAILFATACTVAGLVALRRFDRMQRSGP